MASVITSGGLTWPQHFDGARFFNPGAQPPNGLSDVLRWKLRNRAEPCPKFVNDVVPSTPPERIQGSELLTTLVNHSTVLLQQRTANILTDPIWSQRCSPLSWIGPERHRYPGIGQNDLPPIDIVLLSHNHYDHLDLPTLRWLARREKATYLVPLGVAQLLHSQNIGPVHELDWGQSIQIGEITVHCVPAIHFSARNARDRNKTLWCGYIVEAQGRTIYFAADSAFGSHFAAIQSRFGSPDLALLPIGAYKPEWFMHPVHMGPPDALKVHGILKAKTSIAIHHGTFQLGDDAIDTPAQAIASLQPPDSFVVLANGQSATIT